MGACVASVEQPRQPRRVEQQSRTEKLRALMMRDSFAGGTSRRAGTVAARDRQGLCPAELQRACQMTISADRGRSGGGGVGGDERPLLSRAARVQRACTARRMLSSHATRPQSSRACDSQPRSLPARSSSRRSSSPTGSGTGCPPRWRSRRPRRRRRQETEWQFGRPCSCADSGRGDPHRCAACPANAPVPPPPARHWVAHRAKLSPSKRLEFVAQA